MLSDNIVSQIKAGAVGILPTDTLYGLVCSASNLSAVARLYTLKSREAKPGTIIAANIDQLVDMGVPYRYLKAVERFWPNPISVVIPVGLRFPELHLGKMSLAVRIPREPIIHEMLLQTGPLLTTSANYPGKPPAKTLDEARAYFGDAVDFYVDGGDYSDHQPSTVIRIIDDAIEILRPGAVTITESGEIIKAESK